MTETQKEYAKANKWILFSGNYSLTEAMNSVFVKEWIRACEMENLFSPPENMLTPIGKIVLPRLAFARDVLGITLNEDILIEVFTKVKNEKPNPAPTQVLWQFRLQQALAQEDYEAAARIRGEMA